MFCKFKSKGNKNDLFNILNLYNNNLENENNQEKKKIETLNASENNFNQIKKPQILHNEFTNNVGYQNHIHDNPQKTSLIENLKLNKENTKVNKIEKNLDVIKNPVYDNIGNNIFNNTIEKNSIEAQAISEKEKNKIINNCSNSSNHKICKEFVDNHSNIQIIEGIIDDKIINLKNNDFSRNEISDQKLKNMNINNSSIIINKIQENIIQKENKNFEIKDYEILKSNLKKYENRQILKEFSEIDEKSSNLNSEKNKSQPKLNILNFVDNSKKSGQISQNKVSTLNSSNFNNNSLIRINYNDLSINLKSKNPDLNYSYFKDSLINLNSISRKKFYELFTHELEADKKNSSSKYRKFDSVKHFYKEISKYDRKQCNIIYNKLLPKENYSKMDQELRLLYLNFIVMIHPFLTQEQMENIEKQIVDIYLLKNEYLGDFSKKSQQIFKESFLNSNKNNIIKNSNNNHDNMNSDNRSFLYDNTIKDYFNKKDGFNTTDVFSVFANVKKVKNLKNLFKILIYDDLLDYLKKEFKIKIKFFFYILILNLEKLSKNKEILDSIYIFKFFFSGQKDDGLGNIINFESNVPFNKTGIEEIDYNLKHLFKKKFFKKGSSLEINGINFDNIYIKFKIEDVFSTKEIAIFEEVFHKIKYFYFKNLERKKAKLSLLLKNNINFVFNILDSVYFKTNNKIIYQNIFIRLEKDILRVYREHMNNNTTIKNSNKESILYFRPYLIYNNQKEAFEKLNKILEDFTEYWNKNKKGLNSSLTFKTKLIPFGSITQFLGKNNADLDLFLDIQLESKIFQNLNNQLNSNMNCNNDDKVNFIYDFYLSLKKEIQNNQINNKIEYIKTKRLFTITFDIPLRNENFIKVDINIASCLGILNSSLLRTYSLLDQRFSILALYLKHIIREYGINNGEKKKNKINNYSWTFILLTFLQDVISPPVLPKILSHLKCNNNFIKVKDNKIIKEITNKKYKNNLNKHAYKSKLKEDLIEFYSQMKGESENMVPDLLNLDQNSEDKKFLEDFYKINKNEMSIAEIFFAFIEFVTFYFKFDTNLIYTSGLDKEEGFYGKHILKSLEFNDIGPEFYINTVILRDPLDSTYNPTSGIDENGLKEVKEGLKKYYNFIIDKSI